MHLFKETSRCRCFAPSKRPPREVALSLSERASHPPEGYLSVVVPLMGRRLPQAPWLVTCSTPRHKMLRPVLGRLGPCPKHVRRLGALELRLHPLLMLYQRIDTSRLLEHAHGLHDALRLAQCLFLVRVELWLIEVIPGHGVLRYSHLQLDLLAISLGLVDTHERVVLRMHLPVPPCPVIFQPDSVHRMAEAIIHHWKILRMRLVLRPTRRFLESPVWLHDPVLRPLVKYLWPQAVLRTKLA